MANELRLSVGLNFSKGGAKVDKNHNITVTVTGDAFTHGVQSIDNITPTLLVEGAALGTAGYVVVKNLDATNYVSFGLSGQYAIKLKAGEIALFRAAAPIYGLANVAAVSVEYAIIED